MDKIKPRTLSGFMELQPDKQVQMDKMRAVLAGRLPQTCRGFFLPRDRKHPAKRSGAFRKNIEGGRKKKAAWLLQPPWQAAQSCVEKRSAS